MNTTKIFAKRIREYKIKTADLGVVNYVNLDNAATTSPLKSVETAVLRYLKSYGSVHRGAGAKSIKSTDIYEESRDVIKNFVGANSSDYVVFTGNTTGAMNACAYYFSQLKGKVAVSEIEHSSSWLPWVKAEGLKALGADQYSLSELEAKNNLIQSLGQQQVLRYSVNADFEFDLDGIEDLFKNNAIKVLVVTASSNVTGYCPAIKQISEIVHKYGAYLVVDACQFIQHHSINMQEMGIDFLAASGHKFYAPYGNGFLIGPKDFFDKFLSYEIGGGNLPYITETGEFLRYHNQLAHDPGTPNAVGAMAMATALNTLNKIGLENIAAHEHNLTKKAFDYLVSNDQIEVFVKVKHLNTVLPFRIKGLDSQAVANELNRRFGIGLRAGSFCTYNLLRKLLKITDDSDIIAAVKAENNQAVPGILRASIGLENSEEDIDRFIQAITIICQEIKT